MRAYAETNFLLEIALEQEQHTECEAILGLVETREITLAVPAYSVAEASTTLQRRVAQRNELIRKNNSELREVSRTRGYEQHVADMRRIMAECLLNPIQEASTRLKLVIQRLLASGSLLPLTGAEFDMASELGTTYDLSLPDAIVLAAQ